MLLLMILSVSSSSSSASSAFNVVIIIITIIIIVACCCVCYACMSCSQQGTDSQEQHIQWIRSIPSERALFSPKIPYDQGELALLSYVHVTIIIITVIIISNSSNSNSGSSSGSCGYSNGSSRGSKVTVAEAVAAVGLVVTRSYQLLQYYRDLYLLPLQQGCVAETNALIATILQGSSATPHNSSTLLQRYSEMSVRVVLDYRDLKRLLLWEYFLPQRSSATSDNSITILQRYSETYVMVVLDYRDLKRFLLW